MTIWNHLGPLSIIKLGRRWLGGERKVDGGVKGGGGGMDRRLVKNAALLSTR